MQFKNHTESLSKLNFSFILPFSTIIVKVTVAYFMSKRLSVYLICSVR